MDDANPFVNSIAMDNFEFRLYDPEFDSWLSFCPFGPVPLQYTLKHWSQINRHPLENLSGG